MLINHASKQVIAKIVYYGPGLSGKTTNLQYIFSITHPRSRGELVSMETEVERTIFFDLLPMNVGMIKEYQTKFQLYTVPGQIFYDSTRKLVLRGSDGIVFVADSQDLMKQANVDSYENLKENIAFYGGKLSDIPLVFQFNKRDLKNIMPVEQMNQDLNYFNRPSTEAVAKTGQGVIETLRKISNSTLIKIKEALEQISESAPQPTVHFDIKPPSTPTAKEPPAFRKISPERREENATRPMMTEKTAAKIEEEKKAMKPPEKESRQNPPHLFSKDGIIRCQKQIPGQEKGIIVEIKSLTGEKVSSFSIPLQNNSRRIDIVLDLQK